MKYPKKMNILGQEVSVELVDTPLYQMHSCPNCAGYRFPVGHGKERKCPSCGSEDTRPIDNTYVLGQYSGTKSEIKNWHSDQHKQVCETSFVHETIEAINSICDLKLPHQTITTLSAALYQAFSTGDVAFGEAA